jgi:hypothetical protein
MDSRDASSTASSSVPGSSCPRHFLRWLGHGSHLVLGVSARRDPDSLRTSCTPGLLGDLATGAGAAVVDRALEYDLAVLTGDLGLARVERFAASSAPVTSSTRWSGAGSPVPFRRRGRMREWSDSSRHHSARFAEALAAGVRVLAAEGRLPARIVAAIEPSPLHCSRPERGSNPRLAPVLVVLVEVLVAVRRSRLEIGSSVCRGGRFRPAALSLVVTHVTCPPDRRGLPGGRASRVPREARWSGAPCAVEIVSRRRRSGSTSRRLAGPLAPGDGRAAPRRGQHERTMATVPTRCAVAADRGDHEPAPRTRRGRGGWRRPRRRARRRRRRRPVAPRAGSPPPEAGALENSCDPVAREAIGRTTRAFDCERAGRGAFDATAPMRPAGRAARQVEAAELVGASAAASVAPLPSVASTAAPRRRRVDQVAVLQRVAQQRGGVVRLARDRALVELGRGHDRRAPGRGHEGDLRHVPPHHRQAA